MFLKENKKVNGENYREVYLILNKLGEEYINKIPKTIYNYIVETMTTSNTENKTTKRIHCFYCSIALQVLDKKR